MRAYLPDFTVIHTEDLQEALDALAAGENLVPLAGGTDLMVYLDAGDLPPCTFLNLQEISDFRRAPLMDTSLTLYPLTTYRETRVTAAIRQKFPLLARAAREVGALAIQSRGTWAGNIANASPAADGVPALMAYDAEVELSSKGRRRSVLLSRFYTGYKRMDRRADELITAIRLPAPPPGYFEYYCKVGTRRFQAISKTLLAGRILLGTDRRVKDIRMALASMAPYTLRTIQTERLLQGRELTRDVIEEAAHAIQDEIKPIDDIRSTEGYRRRVTSNLVRDFLSSAIETPATPEGPSEHSGTS
jgi:CO/xanthine dehydrogenase FAD-binding subunit